jgi:hypothetical protein
MDTQANYFGSTYGSGPYGSSTYDGAAQSAATTQSTAPAATPTANGGVLANTGFDVMLAVSLACLIIFVALVIRFWRRPSNTTQPAGGLGNDPNGTRNS